MIKILIIPGLGDSVGNHWQANWLLKFDNSVKLIQDDWEEPKLDKWLEKLNETIEALNSPIVLVAHSLGVALVTNWAKNYKNPNIKGALLVAPADVDSPAHTPDVVRNFGPMPTAKLPFPSTVVASKDDEYVNFTRAKNFAEQWGSDFVNIGAKGHINADSNLGFWEEGQQMLKRFI